MTQELFFGTIYSNLQYLVGERLLLRALGYDSVTLKELRKTVRETPDNIRAYDLIFDNNKKTRIFLGFVDGNSEKDYKNIKYQLRRWNQINGYAFAEDGVVDGVVIIGTSSSWNVEVTPTPLDLPVCVKGHLLYSPNVECNHFGNVTQEGVVNPLLKKFFLPIRCQERVTRIREFSQMIISSGPFVFLGYPTLKRVAEWLGAEIEEIVYVWLTMEAEGVLKIRELSKLTTTIGCSYMERIYIENGTSMWLRRMWCKRKAKSSKFCLNLK